MPASKTELCQLALSHLGVGMTLVDVDTDTTEEARALRTIWDYALETSLRTWDFKFAAKVASLSLFEEDPTDEWAYAYTYPSDCLLFRKILSGLRTDNVQSRIRFEIHYGDNSTVIHTDEADAVGKYTRVVSNVSRFPTDFALGLSFYLAFLTMPRLSKGDPYKKKGELYQLFNFHMKLASSNAATEEQPDEEPDSEFTRVRS